MKRALPAGEYFVMLTIAGNTSDGTSGTSHGRNTYTLAEPATEKDLFEQALKDVLGKSHIVTEPIIMLWHVSVCG